MSKYLFVLNAVLRMISELLFKIVPRNSVLLASFSPLPAHSPLQCQQLAFSVLSECFVYTSSGARCFALLCKQISSLPSPRGCRSFLRA